MEQGSLARAVHSQQSVDLVFLECQVRLLEHLTGLLVVAECQIFYLYHTSRVVFWCLKVAVSTTLKMCFRCISEVVHCKSNLFWYSLQTFSKVFSMRE